MAKTGPKGPRAKVKRVLLIEGHPDCLFLERERQYCTLKWKDQVFKLGAWGDDLVNALKEMNTYAQVTTEQKKGIRAVTLPDNLRATMRKVGDNTHITVSAAEDKALAEEMDKVINYLEKLGLSVIERCHWTCDYDPGSKRVAIQPTPYPVSYDLKTGKVDCGVYRKIMLFPRDCDVCMLKKTCGTYTEMKENMETDKNAIGQKQAV